MPHPLTKGTAFFTQAEQDWIRSNLTTFCEIQGKGGVLVAGHMRKQSTAASHHDVLKQRFVEQFPYRDPKCEVSYDKKYKGLECSEKEWHDLGRVSSFYILNAWG